MSDYDIIFEEIYGTNFETFEKHFIMSMITAFLRNQEYDDWGTSWRSAQIDTAEYYRKNNFDLGDDYDKTVNSSITRGMTGIGQNGPFNNRNGMLDKISQFFRGEENGISVPIISNLGESQTKKIIEKIRSFTKNEFPFKQKPAQSTGTEEINTIIDLLRLRKNVILEGVPGTGKTWIRDKVRKGLNDAEMEVVTFHPASTYEEFVGGIFPTPDNEGSGTLLFEYQDGTLSQFANTAMSDEERDYILFIDEINRANIPLVMGELLTIVESTKRTEPSTGKVALSDGPNSDGGNPWEVAVHAENDDTKSKYLRLPSNLYILATMNTSDRSVVSMDAALRRRFAYFRIETKLTEKGQEEMWAALKGDWWGDKKDTFDTVFSVLAKINQLLETEIGPDAMLGHSYLFFNDDEVTGLDENQVVSEMMELNILPQIADTLTSMNKTDQNSVDSINKLLSKIPTPMFRHELKAPTSGGKSLDIAVTVCERIKASKTIVANLSRYSDDKIFVLNNDKAGPKIKDISGYMVEKDSRIIVLEGSGSISPEFHLNAGKELKPKTIADLKSLKQKRDELIIEGDIIVIDENHGIFQNDVAFDSISGSASMVRGTALSGNGEWRRKSDNTRYGHT